MLLVVLTAIILLAAFIPQFWVRHVMRRYARELPDLPGTGGELAEHLIERLQLEGTRLEQTDEGTDHYDPQDNVVRLSPSNYSDKSLTAVAVAAHEVGHAIQFVRQEPISRLRGKYIPLSILLRKIGLFMLMAVPIVAIVLRVPAAMAVFIGISLLLQLAGAAMYLIVLPEEWDASFNKALPILQQGEYLTDEQVEPVRQVLRAAALTYFSAALADVLNIGRWFLLLRR